MTDGIWVRSTDNGAIFTPDRPQIIVAEITKIWASGEGVGLLLAQRFELILNWNRARGYELRTFQISQFLLPHPDGLGATLTETIIAVFELQASQTS